MKKFLFVCSANQLRSPTAEAIYTGNPSYEVKSAGTDAFNNTVQLTRELVDWADVIYVMEKHHWNKMTKMFGFDFIESKKVVVLNIPDRYQRMDPDLIKLLKSKLGETLG